MRLEISAIFSSRITAEFSFTVIVMSMSGPWPPPQMHIHEQMARLLVLDVME